MNQLETTNLVEHIFKQLPGSGSGQFRRLTMIYWKLSKLPTDFYYHLDHFEAELNEALDHLSRQPHYIDPATYLLTHIAVGSQNRQLQTKALRLLRRVPEQSHINALCQIWEASRQPELEALLVDTRWLATMPISTQMLTALKTGQTSTFLNSELNPVEIEALCEALEDSDAVICARAAASLKQIPLNAQALEVMAWTWLKKRTPLLIELINKSNYVAEYAKLKIYIALKCGGLEPLQSGGASWLEHFLTATQDSDQVIAERACQVLGQLTNPEAREALCLHVIRQDMPLVQPIVLKAGYLPSQPHDKALFYFVTEQWESYESLDFDQRILATAYQAADSAFRRRLAEKVRAAGRVEYLSAITGDNSGSTFATEKRLAEINLDEAGLMVQILAANHAWEKLWQLVFVLPLSWSLQALRHLLESGWKPSTRDEEAMLVALSQLSDQQLLTDEKEAASLIPLALPKAKIKVAGRVNDLAFSPSQPLIAVATGQGKVVLWNMQKARREKVLGEFGHSIGRLAYTPASKLVIAERASSQATTCAIYVWENDNCFRLGQHQGAVTALVATQYETVLSAGRDGRVFLWEIAGRREISHIQASGPLISDWPRQLCLKPDGSQVAVVGRAIRVFSLPNLKFLDQLGLTSGQQAGQAVFTPESEGLVLAQTNGLIIIYPSGRPAAEPHNTAHTAQFKDVDLIQELAYQPNPSRLIIGWANGQIEFYDWPQKTSLGCVQADSQKLTSLTIAPDGGFMATGDLKGSFQLWDLRLANLPRLFSNPLAQGQITDLAALLSLKESGTRLDANLEAALAYIELVLRHRLRYTIELDELPTIQAGEFDLELE